MAIHSTGVFTAFGDGVHRWVPNEGLGPGLASALPTAALRYVGQIWLTSVGASICAPDGFGGYEWVPLYFVGLDNRYVAKAGDTMTGNLFISNTAPELGIIETDAAADNKRWRLTASGERLYLQTLNDAVNATGDILIVDRTGTVVDSITVPYLAGTGSRRVEASATGVLSAAKIPGMDLVGVGAASGANLDFINVFSSTYTHYLMLVYIDTLATSAELYTRLGNSSSFDSGANDYQTRYNYQGTAFAGAGISSTVIYSLVGAAGQTWQDLLYNAWISNPSDSAAQTHMNFTIGGIRAGADWYMVNGTGNRKADKAFTDLRILASTGNMTGAKGMMYGMRKA